MSWYRPTLLWIYTQLLHYIFYMNTQMYPPVVFSGLAWWTRRLRGRDGKWGSQCVCSPLGSSQWESTTCGIVSLSAIGPQPGPRPRLHNAWFAGNGPKNLASTRPFPQERLAESSVGGIFMTIAGRRSETLQVICQIFLWEFLFIWENISVFLWIFWIWMSRRDTFRCRWQVTVIVHSTFWESASHGKFSSTEIKVS